MPFGWTTPFGWTKNLVFVVMPFSKGPELKEVYNVIKDECSQLGLITKRADELVGAGLIIEDVKKQIQKAEFIICDLTYERPNVYYELGYAHGVGNKPLDILLIAKEGTELHFDIAPLRVRYYQSMDELRSILSFDLREMIKRTRRGK